MTKDELLHRAKEAEDLAQHLLEFASRLRARSPEGEVPRLFWPSDKLGLHETAARLLTFRAQRSRHLDASLFGEMAWDLLLTLFKAQRSATGLSLNQLCKSIGPYESTARRWLAVLVEMDLVAVTKERGDATIESARLTQRGEMAMTKTIIELQDALMLSGRYSADVTLLVPPIGHPN
jgi:hypothetical protein